MFGRLQRIAGVFLLSMGLAACQVIPSGSGPAVGTGPVISDGPTDIGLPTDEDRHRIALLVPLAGDNAEVGQSLANAVTMALLDTSADNIRITTYDTSGGAGIAATRAISDGNRLILGPLVRDNVNNVLGQARPAGIPLISFTNDSSVARPDVFVVGHLPEQSIDRTVSFAIAQGARRFAALAPQGEYGQRALTAMQNSVTRNGGTMVGSESYSRGNTSIVSAASRLDARGGFDTVLIADGARLAAMAATELKDAGDVLPSIIGPEIWSGETALTRSPAMEGAWFSAVSDRRYRQFATAYEARFGSQPYRIATLGYDSVLWTLRIARDWTPGTDFPVEQMLDPNGFIGVDGVMRFSADGLGERAMEVREVRSGDFVTVEQAPTQF